VAVYSFSGQEERHTHTATAGEMTGECRDGKDQTDRNLDIENKWHTSVAL